MEFDMDLDDGDGMDVDAGEDIDSLPPLPSTPQIGRRPPPSRDEVLRFVTTVGEAMLRESDEPDPVHLLFRVIDVLTEETTLACSRDAALEALSEMDRLTPEAYVKAIECGVAGKMDEQFDHGGEATQRRAGGGLIVQRAAENEAADSLPAEERLALFAHGVKITAKVPETTFFTRYGEDKLAEERFRLHPGIVARLESGITLTWQPPRQTWTPELRAFVIDRCSITGTNVGDFGCAFVRFVCAHSAYEALAHDTVLSNGFMPAAREDRSSVFGYARRPVFINFVKGVNEMMLTQGGDPATKAIREQYVRLWEACPPFESVVTDENQTPLAQRLRWFHETGGADFTLLLGRWRISMPR